MRAAVGQPAAMAHAIASEIRSCSRMLTRKRPRRRRHVAGAPSLVFFFFVAAFAVMILGMVGKLYYDHLTKNAVFSLTQILLPVIVAPMVYGAIYGALRSSMRVPGSGWLTQE